MSWGGSVHSIQKTPPFILTSSLNNKCDCEFFAYRTIAFRFYHDSTFSGMCSALSCHVCLQIHVAHYIENKGMLFQAKKISWSPDQETDRKHSKKYISMWSNTIQLRLLFFALLSGMSCQQYKWVLSPDPVLAAEVSTAAEERNARRCGWRHNSSTWPNDCWGSYVFSLHTFIFQLLVSHCHTTGWTPSAL